MSYKYQNKSDTDLMVPGVGVVAAGGEIESQTALENVNLELVSETNNSSVVGTEAPQPSTVVQAQRVDDAGSVEIK